MGRKDINVNGRKYALATGLAPERRAQAIFQPNGHKTLNTGKKQYRPLVSPQSEASGRYGIMQSYEAAPN
jgi:hypothetical protein